MVGTDDYMTRPISVSDPLARVSRLLRRAFGLLLETKRRACVTSWMI